MTVYSRYIISEPVRSASETWNIIVNLLIAEEADSARQELLSVIGAVGSLLADEAIKGSPIVAYGAGPRIRFYCLYGEDAITGEQANERPLPATPIRGNWTVSLPCPPDDLAWVQGYLKKRSSHIFARDLNDPVDDGDQAEKSQESSDIDLEAFLRP